MTKKSFYIFTIVILTILTTFLHFVFMQKISPHVIFEELYYLPLLMGVLLFSMQGAVITWLFVSAAYIPFFFAPWTTSIQGYADRTLHLVLSGVIALVVGTLVERERKKSKEVEHERYLAGVGRIATVIVHDLKNPLISISGFARRICEGKGDCGQAAQAIAESARAMQRIVNDVLDFAKPIQLDLNNCNLVESITRSVDECRTKAVEREVTVLVNVPVGNFTITIDRFHIERALVNLIDNSIDASHQGGQVIISAKMSRKELVVSIADRGSGMNRETLEHVFELFYTTKTSGTGLGMPIVKKIIEEHGGKLAITSKKGVGTEATVHLPTS
ncbi:MAG: HAMP domain-containing sensor histidine kinase [Desulfuromonadaceae bacterium]|nr:HAMP domain-containing sensor histidine kinase [Desulfuromonadaceae bacterium]